VSQPFYTTFKKNEEEEKKYSLEKKKNDVFLSHKSRLPNFSFIGRIVKNEK
jgi:hypothetical protein